MKKIISDHEKNRRIERLLNIVLILVSILLFMFALYLFFNQVPHTSSPLI